jgi:hypothetical protein
MKAQDEGFQVYLRGEVEAAGQRYDAAVERLFDMLDGENRAPDLVCAVQVLSENLRLYSGAIRRMTHFATNH